MQKIPVCKYYVPEIKYGMIVYRAPKNVKTANEYARQKLSYAIAAVLVLRDFNREKRDHKLTMSITVLAGAFMPLFKPHFF